MLPSTSGSIRLFKVFGVTVYLHWTWFIIAIIGFQSRRNMYSSPLWNVLEYLTLFAIVTLHEFGHSLACRSVGGKADQIILWPLGGVAFVSPPERPGAMLWSIAAGPLVNLILVPITLALVILSGTSPLAPGNNLQAYLSAVFIMNLVLLFFNMLPIYPLDGGQIMRSLLWFVFGQARSLLIASVLGIVTIAAGVLFLLVRGVFDPWLILITVFAVTQCLNGIQHAKALLAIARMPAHTNLRCPSCGQSPPAGPILQCSCGQRFDPFYYLGQCPACGNRLAELPCVYCRSQFPPSEWQAPVIPPYVPPLYRIPPAP